MNGDQTTSSDSSFRSARRISGGAPGALVLLAFAFCGVGASGAVEEQLSGQARRSEIPGFCLRPLAPREAPAGVASVLWKPTAGIADWGKNPDAFARPQYPRGRAGLPAQLPSPTPALTGNVAAEDRELRISRTTGVARLDEFLEGRPDWAAVRDFRQREPADGAPSSERTEAYLAYDDQHLYVVFICWDVRGKVRAHMAKRENISGDDRVMVYLDTFRDGRRAYVFSSNPLGVQQDSILTEGQSPDLNFDTVWHSEGKLTDDGYAVMLKVPFKSLRFSSQPVQSWGVALSRFIVRNQETAFWPHITRKLQGTIQQMAELNGLERISPLRNLQFNPYGAFSWARFFENDPPGFATHNEGRGGVDAKIVLRDAMTLDVTVNPDFSQVESDDPQVTVNQRFEVFFPEKRPFFIENSGFFRTPVDLFFSRRIADPEFGTRLTGRFGSWTMGALAADDRAPGSRYAAGHPLNRRRAGIGVLRLQQEFQNQSSIGFLATRRDFAGQSNRVFSLDTRLRMNPNWFFTGQAIASNTKRPDGLRHSGKGYLGEISHEGEHFTYKGSYADLSPGFRSEVGFIPRVDVRKVENYAGYLWRPKQSRILSIGPSVSAMVNWDRTGRIQDWYANGGFSVDFKGPSGFRASRYEAFELYWDRGFRHGRTDFSFYTDSLQVLSVYGSFGWGSGLTYVPAPGVVPFTASAKDAHFGLTLRPTPRLRYEVLYYYSQLGAPSDALVFAQFGRAGVFSNQLVRSKLNYQFNRRISARLILDYYAVSPNTALITETPLKRASGDLLVTYLVNPGTALHIGYADRYDNLDFDPSSPSAFRYTSSPRLSTARQFFVKLSYLIRF